MGRPYASHRGSSLWLEVEYGKKELCSDCQRGAGGRRWGCECRKRSRLPVTSAPCREACLIDSRGLREGYESPELRGATDDQARRFLTVVEGAF